MFSLMYSERFSLKVSKNTLGKMVCVCVLLVLCFSILFLVIFSMYNKKDYNMTYHVINFRQFLLLRIHWKEGTWKQTSVSVFITEIFLTFLPIYSSEKMLMCRLYNVWLDDISVVELLWYRKILSMYHTFAHLIIKSDLKLFMEYCFCYKIKGEKK